jgi:hypothetical protein
LYKTVKQPAWHLSSCATASHTLSLANSFSSWRCCADWLSLSFKCIVIASLTSDRPTNFSQMKH